MSASTQRPAPLAPLSIRTQGETGYMASAFTPKAFSVALALFTCVLLAGEAWAQLRSGGERPGILATLWKWTPLVLLGPPREFGGFALNVAVSFLAMAIGTLGGVILGLAQISIFAPVRKTAWGLTVQGRLVYCSHWPMEVKCFSRKTSFPTHPKSGCSSLGPA